MVTRIRSEQITSSNYPSGTVLTSDGVANAQWNIKGHTIQDDGNNLEQRSKLNFVGDSFVLYDDSVNEITVISGTASGGASGIVTGTSSFEFDWYVDGTIATGTNVWAEYIAPRDMTIEKVMFSIKEKGSAGSSIVDIHLNGTTIFNTRPTIAFGDPDNVDIVIPTITSISQNDVLVLDIDQVATGAESISVGIIFTGWVSNTGTSSGSTGSASYLDDLLDVNAPSPNNADALVWDSGSGMWIPSAIGGLPAEPDNRIPFYASSTLTSDAQLTVITNATADQGKNVVIGNRNALINTWAEDARLTRVIEGNYYHDVVFAFGSEADEEIFYANGDKDAPSATLSGDFLYRLGIWAYDDAGFDAAASIEISPTQNWTSTNHGAHVVFNVTRHDDTAQNAILDLYADVAKVAGSVELSTGTSGAYYLGDMNTDGSWRIARSGNNLVMQRREASSWVTKSTISA